MLSHFKSEIPVDSNINEILDMNGVKEDGGKFDHDRYAHVAPWWMDQFVSTRQVWLPWSKLVTELIVKLSVPACIVVVNISNTTDVDAISYAWLELEPILVLSVAAWRVSATWAQHTSLRLATCSPPMTKLRLAAWHESTSEPQSTTEP